MAQPPAELEGRIVRETENAMLFDYDGTEHWIPLSTIERITRNPKGLDHIWVAHWLAYKKGII